MAIAQPSIWSLVYVSSAILITFFKIENVYATLSLRVFSGALITLLESIGLLVSVFILSSSCGPFAGNTKPLYGV